jgi:hypothetical protein
MKSVEEIGAEYARAHREWFLSGGKCCVCGTTASDLPYNDTKYWIGLKIGVCRKCRFTEEFDRLVDSITGDGSQSNSTR